MQSYVLTDRSVGLTVHRSVRLATRGGSVLLLGLLSITARNALAQSNANNAAATPDDASGVQEVVVTATRQSEAISKVAVSVTAITPEAIEQKGMKSFADIARFTPGVNFNTSGNRNTIAIRGIASGAGSGTTGIYLDDTPVQMRALGFSADDSLPGIFDLERVEVLRGPQGTLFGAGSEGGTVRYITKQPSLNHYSGDVRAEASFTRHGAPSAEVGAAFGGPIINDVLGFRVSAWDRHDGGYIDRQDPQTDAITGHNVNHGNVSSLRAALTWQPASGLTVTPSISYQKRDMFAPDYFVAISNPGRGDFRTGSPETLEQLDRFSLPALLIRYDWSSVSLISNTSYFKRDNFTGYDGTLYDLSYYQQSLLDCDGCAANEYPLLTPTGINKDVAYYRSPALVTNNQRNLTQELRVQSNDPTLPVSWVAGVFFQRNRQHSAEELIDPMVNQLFTQLFGQTYEEFNNYPLYQTGGHLDSYINDVVAQDKQTAVFADITYKITRQLKLTVGGRYAWTNYRFRNFADGTQNASRTSGEGETSEHPFTPKAGLSYQMDEDNLFYVTYAKGFREGGANAPVPYDVCKTDLQQLGLTSSPDAYKSDTVKSWEIGAKNNLLDHKLQIATSVYLIDWNQIQESVLLGQCGVQFTGNLGTATSRGFDIQANYRPMAGLSFETAIGYTNAHHTRSLTFGDQPVVSAGDGLGALGIAPWTIAFGVEKSLPLFNDRAYIRLDDEYKARVNKLTQNRDPRNQSYDSTLVPEPAQNFLSLRAGVAFDSLNVSAFVDNLLNSHPQLDYSHLDRDTALYQASTFRPMTVGVTATYSFR